MLYRILGKTGLRVSIVGFGASPLGAEFGAIDPAEGRLAVHHAIDQGINYFDVAPYYGRTLAEERLGEFLKGRRHEVVLATKAGRYDKALPDGFDFSARRIQRSIDESLRRLRTDHVDVFQVHDVEYGRRQQIVYETLPAMRQVQEQGKARFIGITGYPLNALREVALAAGVDTILSYCRYDLMDMALDQVLAPLTRQKGIGLINASPLHMRALTERGAPDWHPAPRRVIEAGARAARLCRERGADIADLSMQFALAHPDVATTLVGMSKTAHVDANVKVVGTQPDPELLAAVLDVLAPVRNICWKEGLAENDDPGAVEKQS